MKTKQLIACSIFFSICFTACKKDDDTDTDTGTVVPKLKTMFAPKAGLTTTYEYDAQGRQSKTTTSDGSKSETSYSGSTVTRSYYLPGNVLSSTFTYTLNTDGLCISVSSTAQPNQVYTRTYNALKQPVNEKFYNSSVLSTELFTTWENGNRVKDSQYVYSSGANYVWVYEHFTDKTSSLEYANIGNQFLGVGNKNVTKSSKRYINGVLDNSASSTDSPEFDASNRIIKITRAFNLNPANPDVFTYTYY